MLPVESPFKTYAGLDGKPLDNGYVYFGQPNQNPITAPVTVYWDAAGTLPALQPLRTENGYIVRAGTPANVFFDGAYSELVRDHKGAQVFYARTSDDFSIATAVSNLISRIASSIGSSLIGFLQDGAGAVPTTVQAVLRESISATRFGLSAASSDNTAALAAITAYLNTFAGTGLLPKITIPAGTYQYATSPNWGITGMCLEAHGNVIFQHNGTGIAFNIDGGATGPGVYGVRVLGKLRISGNANTTRAVYLRAVHHSEISVRPINCNVALETAWCVCTAFDVRCSPVGYPAFTKVPVTGILLDKRNAGELTSGCSFHSPIIEGVSGYGLNLAAAIQNTFIGGTSESNGGGVFVSATSNNNNFVGLDMEFNTTADILCQGAYNKFDAVLSATTSSIGGQANTVLGGMFNSIVSNGIRNRFDGVTYGTNFGAFTDTGTDTIKYTVRNSVGGGLDPDLMRNPQQLVYIDGPAGNNTILGSDDQIGGGSANDFSLYHYGMGEVALWGNGVKKIRYSGTGIGFNAAAPMAKPNITGSRGGSVALGNLLTQLALYGLIIDSTTA